MRRNLIRALLLVCCALAALGAGHLVLQRVGGEALRREAEEQLGRLLAGRVAIAGLTLSLRDGLVLEGEQVSVYPAPEPPHRPALIASRVRARLDALALLTGRFHLLALSVEDLQLRIVRHADGSWSFPPLQALRGSEAGTSAPDLERHLAPARVFEHATRFLLESERIARRVEVSRGRVDYVDETPASDGTPMLSLCLDQITGSLVHDWLGREADLELGGLLISAGGASPAKLHAEGRRRGNGPMQVVLSTSQLPLETFAARLGADGPEPLGGALSGQLVFETRGPHQDSVELSWSLADFNAAVPVAGERVSLVWPEARLDARLELQPGRLSVERAELRLAKTRTRLSGVLERPLRPSSRARFETDVSGMGLEEVRSLARSLPGEDARTLDALLKRVSSGRVDRVGGSGSARLFQWRRLLLGELESLPEGFVLDAELSEVAVESVGRARLDQLGARVEWSGDRLWLRRATARWDERPLPPLQVDIQGVSNLFRAPESERTLSARASSLPGLPTLWRLLSGPPEPEDGAPAEAGRPPPLRLRIDALEHPALRWPLRAAHLRVEPTEQGLQALIREARWAGAPVRGEAVWVSAPEPLLSVNLRVEPPGEPDPATGAPSGAGTTPGVVAGERSVWASGRFELDTLAAEGLPLRSAAGDFSLREDRLLVSQLRADLDPSGKLVGDAEIGLASSDALPVAINFSLVAGDVGRLGRWAGLPEGFATGRLQLTGALDGSLSPEGSPLADLRGELGLDARDGEVRRELPVLLALVQASEDLDSASGGDALRYDFVKAEIELDRGRFSSQDFRLEGPLRLYASGFVDVGRQPQSVEAVVGVFLFRAANQLLESLQVRVFLPGSDKGLVGAYFRVGGDLGSPRVKSLPARSIAEGLPDVMTAPFRMMQLLLRSETPEKSETGATLP